MRRCISIVAGLAFLLFGVVAFAQYGSSSQSNSSSNTSQATSSTPNGQQSSIEGCLVKEQTDYFLVPKSGNPIELQASASEDLSKHEGHRVKVRGNESPISAGSSASTSGAAGGASGAAVGSSSGTNQTNPSSSGAIGSQAGSSQAGAAGTASGTGNDLHKLASEQISVVEVQHVAASCPANWNPKVPIPSGSGSMK